MDEALRFIGQKNECNMLDAIHSGQGESTVSDAQGVRVESLYPPSGTRHPDPIIFVHGGLHGSWCFKNFMTFFAGKGWEGHALNWFNHNGSASRPEAEFLLRGIPEVVEEIGCVAATLTRPPILVGHSMGGMAAQKYAEANPTRALVLLAPVVSAEADVAPIQLEFERTVPFHVPPQVASHLFFDGLDEEEASRCYALLTPTSPTCVQQALSFSVSVDYAKIKCPVLAFGAEHDPLVPGEYVRALAKLAGAEFHMMSDRGHNLLMEPRWRETATIISDWLVETLK